MGSLPLSYQGNPNIQNIQLFLGSSMCPFFSYFLISANMCVCFMVFKRSAQPVAIVMVLWFGPIAISSCCCGALEGPACCTTRKRSRVAKDLEYEVLGTSC